MCDFDFCGVRGVVLGFLGTRKKEKALCKEMVS